MIICERIKTPYSANNAIIQHMLFLRFVGGMLPMYISMVFVSNGCTLVIYWCGYGITDSGYHLCTIGCLLVVFNVWTCRDIYDFVHWEYLGVLWVCGWIIWVWDHYIIYVWDVFLPCGNAFVPPSSPRQHLLLLLITVITYGYKYIC